MGTSALRLEDRIYATPRRAGPVGLVLLWSNLGTVLLPFLAAITVASLLALPLQRAAERSGLPRARERCVHCRGEPVLLRTGHCPEACAVNRVPTLPLLLFVATTTVALFAFGDPGAFRLFVLPLGMTGPGVADLLAAGLVGANAGAAVLLAGYFLQDLPDHRLHFGEGAILLALGLLAASATAGGFLERWIALALPISLLAVLLALGIDWRARHGRPAFGLRALGVATAPLFLVSVFAAVRIVQILQLATT